MYQISDNPNRILLHNIRPNVAPAASLRAGRNAVEYAFLFLIVSAIWGLVIYTALASL
jgi:hypothetical protein